MQHYLDTKTISLSELISNGRTFVVPKFQRDYSWYQDNWEDLWYDICELEKEKFHFMGYIVLQQGTSEKDFIIIDGQQRLTTLSIIALAVIKNLEDLVKIEIEASKNQERIETLKNTFIGYKDPASLVLKSKLILNRNNNDHYQNYIVRLRKRESISRLKPSEKLMSKAFEYFNERIKEFLGAEKSGEKLAGFLNNTIAEYLWFTIIAAHDDINAYKVFETLNARGVRLSTTDLLKNLLFFKVSSGGEADIEQAERQWQSINNTLEEINFPLYLRHFWNSRHPLARQENLFKEIKNSLKNASESMELLNELEKMADIYAAFRNPEDELWRDDTNKRKAIEELKLFNVSQCYSLLLSAKEKLDNKEFVKLLRYCVVISFRYNVIGGLNPNEMERKYNSVAQKVFKGELTKTKDIFKELKEVYIGDREFVSSFASKTLNAKSKKRLLRYILFEIENYKSKQKLDFDDGNVTIEHILPDIPDDNWGLFFNIDQYEQYTDRLGNYTLLNKTENEKCGQKPYEQKINVYTKSSFKLSNELKKFNEWNPKSIETRQSELADIAARIWRIDI